MRVLVLLALLVPTIAAAKYEGVRYQRDPITVVIVFSSADEAVRTALDDVHAAGAGRVVNTIDFDNDVAMTVSGSEAILIGHDEIIRVPLDELRGDSIPRPRSPRTDLAVELELALAELAKSPHRRRALIIIGDDVVPGSFPARAYNFRTRVYGPISSDKLVPLMREITREQPPIESATVQPAEPRRIPWFGLGVAAFAVAITAGVWLARPARNAAV